jgi:hypothetical protein
MAKHKPPTIHRVTRPGEGVEIHMTRQTIQETPGIAIFNIDLSHAPVPDRRYVADMVAVADGPEFVRLFFGQIKVGSKELRSLLDVHMSLTAIGFFIGAVGAAAEEHQVKSGVVPGELSRMDKEPDQTVGLAANLVAVSLIGTEACVDFYLASAFAMGAVAQGGKMLADPVVRITMPSSLVLALIKRLQQIRPTPASPLGVTP